jgi:hypothetical protein
LRSDAVQHRLALLHRSNTRVLRTPRAQAAVTRSARHTTAADVPGVLALFDAAGLRPNREPQHLHWKYWQPRPDWPSPRSFVLTDGNELIAHAALVPASCAWERQRIRLIHLIDWAARPGAVGAGVALMKHLGQRAEALLAVGGSAETQQILPHVGYCPAGAVTGYVRPLFPLRLLSADGVPLGRTLARIARNAAWTLAAPTRRGAEWQARRLAGADIEQIATVLPRSVRGMAVLERSIELFRYMLACPIVPMALFAVERAGRMRGYFLLASAPGQVRIADCWLDSDEPGDWRAMILCAVEEARRDPQAAEVVIWANDRLLAESLRACGFHARVRIPVQLRAAAGLAKPPLPLRVQMLDTDAAFLHHGAEHWT